MCGFCRSTLVREGEALRRIGESAELFDDHSPLQLGVTGRWQGLAFTPEQFKTVTSLDKAAWQAELKLHEELFSQLAYHLPAELTATKEALAQRLAA